MGSQEVKVFILQSEGGEQEFSTKEAMFKVWKDEGFSLLPKGSATMLARTKTIETVDRDDADDLPWSYQSDEWEDLDKVGPPIITTPTQKEEPVLRTVAQATVSQVAVARQEQDGKYIAALGVTKTPPHYTPGRTVIALGYDNLNEKHTEWMSLPKTGVAAEALSECIIAERRESIVCEAGDLQMLDDGRVVVGYGNETRELGLERQGLGSLIRLLDVDPDKIRNKEQLFPRGKDLLLNLDPKTRAHVFNRQMCDVKNRKLKLRTRKYKGERSVFAGVSEGYVEFDADKICQAVALAVPEHLGHRAEVTYNSVNTSLNFLSTTHCPPSIVDFSAGDAFKVGYTFKSNDAGSGSLNWANSVFRNLCLNLIIIAHDKSSKQRLVHKSTIGDAARMIEEAIRDSLPAQEYFARQWGTLQKATIQNVKLWGRQFSSLEDALIFSVESGKFGTASKKSLLAGFEAALEFEPSETLDGLVNVMTRAAHSSGFTPELREQLEVRAGLWMPMLTKAADEGAKNFYV